MSEDFPAPNEAMIKVPIPAWMLTRLDTLAARFAPMSPKEVASAALHASVGRRMTLEIDDDTATRLEKVAEVADLPLGVTLSLLVRSYLNQRGKPAGEAP